MANGAAKLVSILIKEIITDRFKRLARDEALTKFLSTKMDPARLVDFHVSAEREALKLAKDRSQSALTGGLLESAIQEMALRIQSSFQDLFGSEVLPITHSASVLTARSRWLRSRVEFYSKWLGAQATVKNVNDLVLSAFRTPKNFRKYLDEMSLADEALAEEIQKATSPTYRLLMRKQLELEGSQAKEVWESFLKASFKEQRELPEG